MRARTTKSTLDRHGGGTSAISQAGKRNPIVQEIAGQAHNDVVVLG